MQNLNIIATTSMSLEIRLSDGMKNINQRSVCSSKEKAPIYMGAKEIVQNSALPGDGGNLRRETM